MYLPLYSSKNQSVTINPADKTPFSRLSILRPVTRQDHCSLTEKLGHQSGVHGRTVYLLFEFPSCEGSSNSRSARPSSTADTCSNRSSARPTPCVVLRSLPVPLGLVLGAPSAGVDLLTALISMSEGKSVITEVALLEKDGIALSNRSHGVDTQAHDVSTGCM